ncbi:MAG: hypothetical protein Q7K42_03805, partial [Candidatus Diapherotrites archaeon]|nr:hypothetical protein [Candidatus Diapherotrites archaeon]
SAFAYFSSAEKKKLQKKYMQMESEFKDSLYVLASRMGENKPVEEALKHTKEFLPNYIVSKELFEKILNNINVIGMNLDAALFDKSVGALKDNPSNMINTSMRLLSDSVKLGVKQASRTLMNLSMQLRNSEKVTKLLTQLTSEITSTMYTMTVFIAPIVLGITTSLQRVVMVTLSNISSSTPSGLGNVNNLQIPGGTGFGDVSSLVNSIQGLGSTTQGLAINKAVLANLATPAEFLVIVAIYVIELVILMSFFTKKIEEDNDLNVLLAIAQALPVAVIIFIVSLMAANMMVGGFFS